MTIKNPVGDIKKVIPELEQIKNYNNTKTISQQAWENRIKTIATKNLKKFGKSLWWGSLHTYFLPCIQCSHSDNKTITINEEKYKLIRKYVMTEEFVLN